MYKILIVDDHPLIINAYVQALNVVEAEIGDLTFSIDTASNCDEAMVLINKSIKEDSYNLAILDIRIEPSSDGTLLSGEDLGLKFRELQPDTRVMVSTTFNDNFRIHSLISNVDPDCFLIKNDITPKELVSAIEAVIKDPPYYSRTVNKLLRKQIGANISLDKYDRMLIYELSIGTTMSDIAEALPFSKASIERRKRVLKEIFDVKNENDRELIVKAKERGFI